MTSERLVEIDAFKGLLICLIVLGHNTLFSTYFPESFSVLYNFHVASFLLLPFIFPDQSTSRSWLIDRVTRLLVPHLVFFFVACAAYFVLFVSHDVSSSLEWLESVGLALLISSEGTYRTASGFGLFWFLPALLSMMLLRAAYSRGGTSLKILIVAASLAIHCFLGFIPEDDLRWYPWGTPLVFFLFPLALLVGQVWRRNLNRTACLVIFLAAFIGCIYLDLKIPLLSGLAGDPRVYAVDEVFYLLLIDVYLLSGFFTLLLLCWKFPAGLTRILAYIGNRSLFVFLFHSFVFRAMIMSGLIDWFDAVLPIPWLSVGVSFSLTLAVSLMAYRLLLVVPQLNGIIFPRSFYHWRTSLGLVKP